MKGTVGGAGALLVSVLVAVTAAPASFVDFDGRMSLEAWHARGGWDEAPATDRLCWRWQSHMLLEPLWFPSHAPYAVYAGDGTPVYAPLGPQEPVEIAPQASGEWCWDGRTDAGDMVSADAYTVRVWYVEDPEEGPLHPLTITVHWDPHAGAHA